MEGLILLGVLGAGYLINEDKKKEEKTYSTIQPPLNIDSGTTIYDQSNLKDAQRYEIDKVQEYHDMAMKGDTKIIDSLNMDGRNTLRDDDFKSSEIINSISGEKLHSKDFLVNDQGIKASPFFKGTAPTQNIENFRNLEIHQGGAHAFRSKKKEVGRMFEMEKNIGNVFGRTFTEADSDQDRYIAGNMRTGELPFEKERVAPIDTKSEINRDIDMIHAQRNSVDNRRTLSNQKTTFKGKVLSGKGINKREEQPEVFKHHPDRDYVNSADKWLVTMGKTVAPIIRPEEELRITNRQYLNDMPTGSAQPTLFKGNQERPMVQKTKNQHLVTDTNRNVSLESKKNDNDHNKSSYFTYPNEREITEERTNKGNFKSVYNANTQNIQDNIKPTIKESTLDDSRNGFTAPTVTKLPEDRVHDKIRATVKETSMFEYSGNPGTMHVLGDMATDKYLRADINPSQNKETISKGRSPTTEKTKLGAGVDMLNVDIQKIEKDYFNPRINNQDNIYQEYKRTELCEITQDKDTLDNGKISDRLDPDMLNPFKNNPYTKSLASFA
tara:strand:- start:352 stop:2010 length:1659 start_codon:yes stop_codon:yes gene_type:complete